MSMAANITRNNAPEWICTEIGSNAAACFKGVNKFCFDPFELFGLI